MIESFGQTAVEADLARVGAHAHAGRTAGRVGRGELDDDSLGRSAVGERDAVVLAHLASADRLGRRDLQALAIQDGGLVIGKGAHTGGNRQRAHKLTVGQSRRLSRFRIQPPSDLALLLSSHGANNTKAVRSQGSNL